MSRSRSKPRGKQTYKFTLDADDPTEAQIVVALDNLTKGYKLSLFMRMLLANSMGLDPFPFAPFSFTSATIPIKQDTSTSSQMTPKALRPEERWQTVRAKRPTPRTTIDEPIKIVDTSEDDLDKASNNFLNMFG